MRVFAFQGIRYTPAADPDPGRLAAPPYDQIDDALRERLQATSPYHFSHLSRPVAGPDGDPYRHAAELHGRWLAAGASAPDERPALYPYSIELAGGGRRLGLAALVGYEEASVIRPHERTIGKPLADRMALLRAMRVDLEPVLLVPEDGGKLDAMLAADLEPLAPVFAHTAAEGHRHLLYRLAGGARIRDYQEALAGKPAAIADGHHRYKVGAMYARETAAEEGTAAAAKLAVLTSIAAAHLEIAPIHRALRERVDLKRLRDLAAARQPWRGEGGGTALAAAVGAAPQPAVGVWPAGGDPEILQLDPERAPATTSRGAARLAVVLLHDVLFPALGLAPEAGTDGTVIYRSDPGELGRMVAEREVAAGFFLPPMSPAEFAAAIAHGDLLAPKSTRFLPKVFSGLVWAGHDSALL
ncbi:MAG TPA: DUF1015 domain-containing protein [Thermoanaerobaculia bacterium]|nr:DUF1015 domain-containing protein [Thermoanaerobaculia bacterium]